MFPCRISHFISIENNESFLLLLYHFIHRLKLFAVVRGLMCGKEEINEKRMPKLKLIDPPIDDKNSRLLSICHSSVYLLNNEAQLNVALSKNRFAFKFLLPPPFTFASVFY
jgi:hypothetical protein